MEGIASRLESLDEIRGLREQAGIKLNYLQLESGPYRGSLRIVRLGRIFIEEERWDCRVEITGRSPDGLVAIIPVEAESAARFQGVPLEVGDIACAPPEALVDFATSAGFKALIVRIPVAVIEEAFPGSDTGSRLEPRVSHLSRPSAERISAAAARALNATDRTAEEDQELAAKLVAAVLASAASDAPGKSCPNSASQIVAAARDYIEHHLDQKIPLEALCAATGTRERTLRRAFRNVLGTSPITYIRLRRLTYARNLLLQGFHDSVAAVARASGFAHLGRFAAYYRDHFHELPSESSRSAGNSSLRLAEES